MSEMPDFGDPKYVDVWADDVVTLSLQYSTQWDSLAHVGAEFDADGDGVEEAVYYNGYRAGTDLVGPPTTPRRRQRPPLLRPPPRPRAHGVPRRAGPRRPRRPGPPPRPRVARRSTGPRSRRSWPPTAWWSSPATCSSCTPATPPRSSSGTRTPTRAQLFTIVRLPRRQGRVAARVDRRLADLRAGGRQLRGRGAARQGPRPEPPLVPPDPPPLPLQARRPARRALVPPRAGRPGCASTTAAASC